MTNPSKSPTPLPAQTEASAKRPAVPEAVLRRARRRRVLLVGGLIAIVCGSLYAWMTEPPDYVGRAEQAYAAGKYDEAVAQYTAALRQKLPAPERAKLHLLRGWAYLAQKEWALAIADCNAVLRLDPDAGQAYVGRALAEAGRGQVPKAMDDLNEAIRRQPTSALAHLERAQLGDQHKAEGVDPLKDVEEAIRLKPDYAQAYALRGMLLYKEKHRYGEAIASCDRAIQLDPRLAEAYLYRGFALIESGQLKQGGEDIGRALELNERLADNIPAAYQKHRREPGSGGPR